ncbi:hypothetical protein [Prosthecobacter sp.]|uniref:hypothetical protein n=1 Tax=Prosthecobacter sp. TaxID=1965333 RepID=UPI0037843B68
MTAILLRPLLSAMLLLMMTQAAAALDLPIQCFPNGSCLLGTNCNMLNYNIQMIVDEVKMKDATLDEAVASIRAAATKAEGPDNRPVNVVVLGTSSDPAKKVSLDLKQVPLKLAVEEVARAFGLQVRPESHAVVLAPPSYPEPIHTRTYVVPSDFISTGSPTR